MSTIQRMSLVLLTALSLGVAWPSSPTLPDTAEAAPLGMSEGQARQWIRYGDGRFTCTRESTGQTSCDTLVFVATVDTQFNLPGNVYANTPSSGHQKGTFLVPCNTQITLRWEPARPCGC